ncbi:MAG: hypothetical protein V3T66_03815 [Alphaproteobacteria bacterium]
MLKKLAIGLVVLAGAYALVSGDYTFASPRYRVMAYAYMAAAQFEGPRASAEAPVAANGAITETNGSAANSQLAAVDPPAQANTYVHLASLRSAASAKQEWSRLQRIFPAQLANLDLILERVRLQSEGVVYRVLADTAESPLSPGQLCIALRQNNQYCTLIKPGAT